VTGSDPVSERKLLADCLIAGTAKVNKLKVMSGNVKHFPMVTGVVNPLIECITGMDR
jgi:predicted nucleic acid-binding protein